MRFSAAVARVAAICGLVGLPANVWAQLRCGTKEDVQIRRVGFEGNVTFTDVELALRVISTPTDISRRGLGAKPKLVGTVAGAAIGAVVGLNTDQPFLYGGGGAGLGFLAGLVYGRSIGELRCIRPGLLRGDIQNLRAFYNSQGFPDARVDTTVTRDGEWVDIDFRVTEGRPALVDSVRIVGMDSAIFGDLASRLHTRPGERYSIALLQEDIDSLETRLRNNGYPSGRVLRDSILLRELRYRAIVNLTVLPGRLAHIGEVVIRDTAINGRPRVDEQDIRNLLRFSSGDVYSERSLFESERRLYRVGAFLSAEITPLLTEVDSTGLVDVRVQVVENLLLSGGVEPGFGTLDCLRARADYTDAAFLHGFNRLNLSASVSKIGWVRPWPGVSDVCRLELEEDLVGSSEINYNAAAQFTRPVPLKGGLLPSLSAYTEKRGAYNAYLRTTKIGGALTLSKNVTRSILAEAGYNLEYGNTKAAESVLCFLFRACDQAARDQLTEDDRRLAILSIRGVTDRRNSLDSASRGGFVRAEFRTSQKFLWSNQDLAFNKGTIDAALYTRFGPGVVALRIRAGRVGNGRDILPPPQERLYAGGETSVRGYSQNELGSVIYVANPLDPRVRDSVVALGEVERQEFIQRVARVRVIPTGGIGSFVGNLEYRLPGPFIPRIQTILFMDVGRVWERVANAGGYRWTPGVGFKYFSPVGPIQFNLGYNKYDYPKGPVFLDQGVGGTLFCLSGTAGAGCTPLQGRAPRSGIKRLTFSIAFPPDF